MIYSLGHVRSAMDSTALISIPGVFVNKGREVGPQEVLNDCSFSAMHRFNLLSMSKLLHKKGLKIMHGNEIMMHFENGKAGVVNFPIVVPTEKRKYMLANLFVL